MTLAESSNSEAGLKAISRTNRITSGFSRKDNSFKLLRKINPCGNVVNSFWKKNEFKSVQKKCRLRKFVISSLSWLIGHSSITNFLNVDPLTPVYSSKMVICKEDVANLTWCNWRVSSFLRLQMQFGRDFNSFCAKINAWRRWSWQISAGNCVRELPPR